MREVHPKSLLRLWMLAADRIDDTGRREPMSLEAQVLGWRLERDQYSAKINASSDDVFVHFVLAEKYLFANDLYELLR